MQHRASKCFVHICFSKHTHTHTLIRISETCHCGCVEPYSLHGGVDVAADLTTGARSWRRCFPQWRKEKSAVQVKWSWPEVWPWLAPLSCWCSVSPTCCRTADGWFLCPDRPWVLTGPRCDARPSCLLGPSSAGSRRKARWWWWWTPGTGSGLGASSSCRSGQGSDIPGCRSLRLLPRLSAGSLQWLQRQVGNKKK